MVEFFQLNDLFNDMDRMTLRTSSGSPNPPYDPRCDANARTCLKFQHGDHSHGPHAPGMEQQPRIFKLQSVRPVGTYYSCIPAEPRAVLGELVPTVFSLAANNTHVPELERTAPTAYPA